MIATNEKTLIKLALQGKVGPADEFLPFEVGHNGEPYALPGVGSITYNVRVGDPAFGWTSDHTEPGVSTVCTSSDKAHMRGYNFLSCVGNEVIITSGDAKGKKGVVTGMHGGVEHVLLDFPDAVIEKLTLEDKFLIRAHGQGLRLTNFPDIKTYNLSPALLHKMPMKEKKNVIEIGVTHIVPAGIMGSGIGSLSCTRGDYDITTQDEETVKKYKLDTIRLGDIVAIEDADNSYGRCYKKGAISICVVVHSNSFVAGHGPGVTTLLTTTKGAQIQPVLNKHANIAEILKIGRHRNK
ncbi:DUF4438 domain-containing protein [Candidatus Peregrinibacteria bacterium CG11_big_fil_rev_8_21_14_0_20_46_8]|nr:MAG: DUF4438 domain-containing protein [Candidatus Peregrinibacteria bacterium CG11_big_fil_rev_8_21_14_0_20_46_8]